MKKAVIFDMDGVLSDSEYIYVEKILEMLEEEGIRIEAVEISDLFGKSMIHLCTELKRRYLGLPLLYMMSPWMPSSNVIVLGFLVYPSPSGTGMVSRL